MASKVTKANCRREYSIVVLSILVFVVFNLIKLSSSFIEETQVK